MAGKLNDLGKDNVESQPGFGCTSMQTVRSATRLRSGVDKQVSPCFDHLQIVKRILRGVFDFVVSISCVATSSETSDIPVNCLSDEI